LKNFVEKQKNYKEKTSKMATSSGKNNNILNTHISETTYVRITKFGTNN